MIFVLIRMSRPSRESMMKSVKSEEKGGLDWKIVDVMLNGAIAYL